MNKKLLISWELILLICSSIFWCNIVQYAKVLKSSLAYKCVYRVSIKSWVIVEITIIVYSWLLNYITWYLRHRVFSRLFPQLSIQSRRQHQQKNNILKSEKRKTKQLSISTHFGIYRFISSTIGQCS